MRGLVALAGLVAVAVAHGHGMRTAYLELIEGEHDAVLAEWRTTVPAPSVIPTIAGCTATDGAVEGAAPHARAFTFRCPGGLSGRTIEVVGLGPILTEAVVRVVRPGGAVRSHVLSADARSWTVPLAASWLEVARQYARLGVEHILTGADHLLFLLALVLYVRRPRDVLLTETAFTVSHSASFSATALGLVRVSAPAAEAAIALSLVLVALDVANPRTARAARWQGPAIALVFGLVHGLGFAGALGEIGLPDRAVAAALVAFGLGVEIGQVLFLAAAMGVLAVIARTAWLPRVALAGSYVVGVTGCAWLFERLRVCFT
jgi:hydrogenase/urease accessory protein HupE